MDHSVRQIKQLKELLKNGVLTQEEFDRLSCKIQTSSVSTEKNSILTILTIILIVCVLFGTCMPTKMRNYLDVMLSVLWVWCSFVLLIKYRKKTYSLMVKLLFCLWVILTCSLGVFLIGKL